MSADISKLLKKSAESSIIKHQINEHLREHVDEELPDIEAPDDRNIVQKVFDQIMAMMSRLQFFQYNVEELEIYESKLPEKKGI